MDGPRIEHHAIHQDSSRASLSFPSTAAAQGQNGGPAAGAASLSPSVHKTLQLHSRSF